MRKKYKGVTDCAIVYKHDGSDKQVPIVIGNSIELLCLKFMKKLPVTDYANLKALMTSEVCCS